MKALLDTNIVIHRETNRVILDGIGVLFRWLDRLGYEKCVHRITIDEINRLKPGSLRDSFNTKLASYSMLQTQAPMAVEVEQVCHPLDMSVNDASDTCLLNEVFCNRVDLLLTEDKKIHQKASRLNLSDRVLTVQAFLERVTAENPELSDYKVLAVRKELFGNIDLSSPFFDSFRDEYNGFDAWFNHKSEETAYVCRDAGNIAAFLYLKPEGVTEPYPDIYPPFAPKKRLKIGTFKVTMNGFRLGERFLKIVFDNAISMRVDEIYVTIFDSGLERAALIRLLQSFGFVLHGSKSTGGANEQVYVRDMTPQFNAARPSLTFPYFSTAGRVFIAPIYPEYHTELFPDSILRTESAADYVENHPYRNAVRKVYISRSRYKDLAPGDVVVFYRTGGYYRSVATTIGIIDGIHTGIASLDDFIRLARTRSVFSNKQLAEHWNYRHWDRPFVVRFLYAYSLPKRPNMKDLIDIGVIRDVHSAPRGFVPVPSDAFSRLLRKADVDDRIIVD